MSDRFATTTRLLRETAADHLLERGSRAFSVEAVARGADTAIGTVYERWNDRLDLLTDVVGETLLPRIRDQVAQSLGLPFDERLDFLLDSPGGRDILFIVAEVIFAARDHPTLIPLANEAVAALEVAVASGTKSGRGAQWWTTSLCVGWGILRMGGADVTPIAPDVAHVLRSEKETSQPRRSATIETPPLPGTGMTTADDEMSVRIVSTARDMLSDSGRHDFSARGVAREAGVSVNSLYRRYGSRADLIQQVLLTDMHEARFTWSNNLMEVLVDGDPVTRASEMLAQVLERVHSDERESNRLLEITVAARTDAVVLAHVLDQIHGAVMARAELVRRMQAASVVTEPPSAESVSWFIQAVPIGVRVLASIGRVPSLKTTTEGLRRVCGACLVDE